MTKQTTKESITHHSRHRDSSAPANLRPAVPARSQRQWVPVRRLVLGESPRLDGEDAVHVRLLAESEAALPPILVHRESMRVIDGLHRLGAALLNGRDTIEVQFFDGGPDEAFVAAVRANVAHGLPLTLADRKAAAARIIASQEHRSDRSIATITGLSAKTVGEIRRQTLPRARSCARSGRDGRIRPLSSADGRRVASEVIALRPEASLREVAKMAGISPATVRDVRERMRRGDDPVPPRERIGPDTAAAGPSAGRAATGALECAETGPARSGVENGAGRDRAALMQALCNDPSLRFTESGRALLRMLFARAKGPDGCDELMSQIPPHCAYTVAEVARSCAREWLDFATRLEQRLYNTA